MAFVAKKKAKKMSRARPASKAQASRPFAPNRAHSAALKEAGPNLMDLICLHFKDKGYTAKVDTIYIHGGLTSAHLGVRISLRDQLPFKNIPSSNSEAEIVFFHEKTGNQVFQKNPNPYTGSRVIPLGSPEDPDLISRLECVIDNYISGANRICYQLKLLLP